MWPATDGEADRAAGDFVDTLWNRLFADPVLLGRYPDPFGDMMPGPVADDLRLISQPLDFYGANYYNPIGVRAAAGRRGPALRVQRHHRLPDDRLRLARGPVVDDATSSSV